MSPVSERFQTNQRWQQSEPSVWSWATGECKYRSTTFGRIVMMLEDLAHDVQDNRMVYLLSMLCHTDRLVSRARLSSRVRVWPARQVRPNQPQRGSLSVSRTGKKGSIVDHTLASPNIDNTVRLSID